MYRVNQRGWKSSREPRPESANGLGGLGKHSGEVRPAACPRGGGPRVGP